MTPPRGAADDGRRIARHRELEAELGALPDDELVRALEGAGIPERGLGPVSLPGSGATVFVKAIPLAARELQPENRHTTSNLFALPTYYQHRLGSYGFGAWRELAAHRLATEWALSGACPHFVLLHGWRVLPVVSAVDHDKANVERWGSHPAIQRRVSAIAAATSSLVLFQEHFPRTLSEWLRDGSVAIDEVEDALLETLVFVNGHGVLHLEPHFENIFTDGTGLFLGDFGLAMSRTFDLASDERAFFERHQNFDRCIAITCCVHACVARLDARPEWRDALHELMDGTHAASADVPADVRAYLVRRGRVALAIGEFYRALLADLSTEYPAETLERLCREV